jgi:hypothetical protein
MGEYIVLFSFLSGSPTCRTFGARRDVLCTQAPHCMLLPKTAHGVGGLYVGSRRNGAGGPVLPLDRFAGSHQLLHILHKKFGLLACIILCCTACAVYMTQNLGRCLVL